MKTMSELTHYNLHELVPQAFRKYIIVRGTGTSCVLNRMFSVIDVLVALRKWKGYNILVDWSDEKFSESGHNIFYKYFKLLNKEHYAFSVSDIPFSTVAGCRADPITRDMLHEGCSSVDPDITMVEYDAYFEHSFIADSPEHFSFLWNACSEKLAPRWAHNKSASGYYTDKLAKFNTVIGVDLDSLHDGFTDKAIDVINKLVCKHTDVRLFCSTIVDRNVDKLICAKFKELYGSRVKFRSFRGNTSVDKIVHSLILSKCSYIVCRHPSLVASYATFNGKAELIEI